MEIICIWIGRHSEVLLKHITDQFPAVLVTGVRQAGPKRQNKWFAVPISKKGGEDEIWKELLLIKILDMENQ